MQNSSCFLACSIIFSEIATHSYYLFFYLFNTGLALSFSIEGHYKCRNNILITMRFDDY
ncbi:hypothetical protein PRABACTJOHN_02835 [Parabacteroides johnsonii DSM 18315]|uniref:Uncharacterized protein n=1 Tax=Parabacteroides johnsonii DSM 18315 TaxID=537006 RepID=B7BCR7_9BACT|nr:hypothetical protein PRABACTJOHN_02835 [Parabacteroides johnsonii DSM 18315]